MTRTLFILGVSLFLAACQERTPTSKNPEQPASPAPAPKAKEMSAAAGTSVMRPSVIAETKEAPPEPPPPPSRIDVMFDEGKALLSEEARRRLDVLLDDQALSAAGEIVLRGHSDTRGSDADNLRASEARAMAVLEYLEARGVPRARVKVVALGETRPIAPNANEDGSDFPEGRAKNRRVEIELKPPAAEAVIGLNEATSADASPSNSSATAASPAPRPLRSTQR